MPQFKLTKYDIKPNLNSLIIILTQVITIQRAVFRWNARKKLKILLEKQKILLEKKKQEFAAGQVIRA